MKVTKKAPEVVELPKMQSLKVGDVFMRPEDENRVYVKTSTKTEGVTAIRLSLHDPAHGWCEVHISPDAFVRHQRDAELLI